MEFKNENGAKLGDFVRTRRFNYQGRIYRKDHNGSEVKTTVYSNPDSKNLKLPWYHILTKDGGAVVVPESDIAEILTPFELKNPWESFFFNA